MVIVTVRGEALRVLNAVGKRPGSAWFDVWREIQAIKSGVKQPAVKPGEIGLHRFRVDGGRLLAVFGINYLTGAEIIIERIDLYLQKGHRGKRT